MPLVSKAYQANGPPPSGPGGMPGGMEMPEGMDPNMFKGMDPNMFKGMGVPSTEDTQDTQQD